MNKAALLNGRLPVLFVIFSILTFRVAQAHIALSTYISDVVVANSLKACCTGCDYPLVSPVLGDDNKLTQYSYTFCGSCPIKFSLSVGGGSCKNVYFEVSDCDKNQFLALDRSKSTLAAQFYWDCKQAYLYMCKDYMVFDQPTGRCVPGGVLNRDIPPLPVPCADKVLTAPLSVLMCESILYKAMPYVCSTCKNPIIQATRFLTGLPVKAILEYTYCADNGYFSIDAVKPGTLATWFIPDCRNKMAVPIDPSRSTIASLFYWDCTYGLAGGFGIFDQQYNAFTEPENLFLFFDIDSLTKLEHCNKTCGVWSPKPYASSGTAYKTILPLLPYNKQ